MNDIAEKNMAAVMSATFRPLILSCTCKIPARAELGVVSRYTTAKKNKEFYGSLVSTSLPDVDSEIESEFIICMIHCSPTCVLLCEFVMLVGCVV